MQAADVARKSEEAASAKRNRSHADSITSNPGGEQRASPQKQEITRLLSLIQHRLTRKQSDWIPTTIDDVASISARLKGYVPSKSQCNEIVLVLDHFISAVLLSSMATDAVLSQLSVMLGDLVGAHEDIDEYIR